MMFHLFSFTHGIWMMSRSETGEKTKFNVKNILINPGTISLVIGLPLYLLKINLPNVIGAPIDYLAALNTPVAMLIFGTYLSNAKIKSALREWRILCVALIKLGVIPLVCLGVFRLCGITGALLTAMIIAASAPPANITVVFAAKYNKDTGLASQTVAIVSFISIVTMPLWIGLASTM
jgi:auxin efflux carrier